MFISGPRERQDGGREVSALVEEERVNVHCLKCPFQGEEKSSLSSFCINPLGAQISAQRRHSGDSGEKYTFHLSKL